MLKFISYALRYFPIYIVAFIFLICGVVVDSFIPRFVQLIIDDVIVGGRLEVAIRLLLFLFVCIFSRGCFKYLQEFTSDILSQRVTRDVRSSLFDHIEKQNSSFFRKNAPSELMSRIRHDSENLGFSFGFCLLFAFEILFHVIIMFICILRISPILSIPVLIFMPIMGILTVKEEQKGDKIYEEISEETATMNKTASEALTGIRTVKAFNREEFEKKRFSKRNKHFFKLSVSLEDLYSLFDGATASLSRIMIAVALIFGGVLVIASSLTLGELASYVEYVNSLSWPMLEIGWLVASFSSSNASARKIKKVLDEKDEVFVKEPIYTLPKDAKLSLSFDHVSFKVDNREILSDISFTILKGKSLGIMGATGSGKSTIGNLLTRFCDPSEGVIKIDGVDISHLPLKELRDEVATVGQDVFLFSESIRENLMKGGEGQLSESQMYSASRMAAADGFIAELDEGYDTVIGERGVGLSGGQKQRLSIARALIRNAPILLLDDSTSALDMETEKEIQNSLKSVKKDGIKIIIAHRISAVRDADEIIYLQDGKIKERGTHESLMALKGLYYSTYVAQYSREDEDGR